jgi:hypothetical protein
MPSAGATGLGVVKAECLAARQGAEGKQMPFHLWLAVAVARLHWTAPEVIQPCIELLVAFGSTGSGSIGHAKARMVGKIGSGPGLSCG